MRLHTNKLPSVISEFLLARVVAKAPTSAAQFGFGFLVPYVSRATQTMLDRNRPMLTSLGIVDTDSMIDLESASSSAREALEKAGGKIEAFGLLFDRADLDAFSELANKYAE